MTKTETKKPGYIDRALIWFVNKVPRFNFIIQQGIGEAYDLGYQRGLEEGMTIDPKNKKAKRSIKRAIKNAYKDIN
tara:strand:- start:325 stop:552 length:228 start_codon:yes stop_codon:yes gene_type:complete